MVKLSEAKVVSRFVKQMEQLSCQIIRVECVSSQGVPDLNYCTSEGVEGWVEFKQQKTKKVKLNLSTNQFLFLRKRSRLNPRVFVVVFVQDSEEWGLVQCCQFSHFENNPQLSLLKIEWHSTLVLLAKEIIDSSHHGK